MAGTLFFLSFFFFFVRLKFWILFVFFFTLQLKFINILGNWHLLDIIAFYPFLGSLTESSSISVLSLASCNRQNLPQFVQFQIQCLFRLRVYFLLSLVSTNIETDIKHSHISPPTFTCMFLSIVVYINCIWFFLSFCLPNQLLMLIVALC